MKELGKRLAISEDYGSPVKVLGSHPLPEPGWLVGYAALIARYGLRVPIPPHLAMATERDRPESQDDWLLIRQSRRPENTLAGHLDFALRREGVDLAVLKALFRVVDKAEIETIVQATTTGVHTRRLWFLYEWLTGQTLGLSDAPKVKAVPILDEDHQVAMRHGELSARHRTINNLPGTPAFCPTVRWTPLLRRCAEKHLNARAREVIGRTHPDVVARAAAFMLLSDSRSSFDIEGEHPPRERIARWGQAIAQAGSQALSVEELERLQCLLVDNRFVTLGLRQEGGFVGDHDRRTLSPLPEHISARPEDVRSLTNGLVAYDARALAGHVDPVIAAATVAFGFVYVHPFVDGNGRIHRWLIHHVLSSAGFSPPNVVFPISAAILREIVPYQRVLESYSAALLPLIEWRPTDKNNIEVLNDTADYYRFFDATAHAEFLYQCVEQTVEHDLPEEVKFLEAFDRFVADVQHIVDMPKTTVTLLHKFLTQGHGTLSKRAREKEFVQLRDDEVGRIEQLYASRAELARDETTEPLHENSFRTRHEGDRIDRIMVPFQPPTGINVPASYQHAINARYADVVREQAVRDTNGYRYPVQLKGTASDLQQFASEAVEQFGARDITTEVHAGVGELWFEYVGQASPSVIQDLARKYHLTIVQCGATLLGTRVQ